MKLCLEGIGLRGPGLADWPRGKEILRGAAPYEPADVLLSASELLPAAERRRMTETVKLALAIGVEAMAHAGASLENTASVFASSGGDGANITAIMEILASEERQVSPTRFHNSVHNAPSGYWSIATHSRKASTSICAYDCSFAAGLLEAATQALSEDRPILLVAYDLLYPPTLNAVRPIIGVFGTALVLSPRRTDRSLSRLAIELSGGMRPEAALPDPRLEALRANNPAGRGLALLAALADDKETAVAINNAVSQQIIIRVSPLG